MSRQFEARTPLEELLVEQALLMARELQSAADSAPDGQVLADAEQAAVRAGREFTRKARHRLTLQVAALTLLGPISQGHTGGASRSRRWAGWPRATGRGIAPVVCPSERRGCS